MKREYWFILFLAIAIALSIGIDSARTIPANTAVSLIGNNNVTFTAVTGPMATFRYIAVYNATASGHNLIGWADYGAETTLTVGQAFTVAFDATNGILQVQ